MKVVSYNIHKGLDPFKRRYVLPEMRGQLRQLDPDIVFLQEVQGAYSRQRRRVRLWEDVSQHEFLAEERFEHVVYAANAQYGFGHHGNSILSKYPILDWENVDISTSRLERRGILRVVLSIDQTKKLQCYCVHFDLRARTRITQFQRLAQLVESTAESDHPVLVCGDFNDVIRQASPFLTKLGLKDAAKYLTSNYAKTYPSGKPLLALDRIYYRGIEAKEVSALSSRPWNTLSDHCPLMAQFSV